MISKASLEELMLKSRIISCIQITLRCNLLSHVHRSSGLHHRSKVIEVPDLPQAQQPPAETEHKSLLYQTD